MMGREHYLVEIRKSGWDTVGFLCGDYRLVRRVYGVYSFSSVLLKSRGSPRATVRTPGSKRPLIIKLGEGDRDIADGLAVFIDFVQALDLVRAGAEWVFSKGGLDKLQDLSFHVAGAARLWEKLESESFYRTEKIVEESISEFSEIVTGAEEEGFRLISVLVKALINSMTEVLGTLKGLSSCGTYLASRYVYGRVLEGACQMLLKALIREGKERDTSIVWVKSLDIPFPGERAPKKPLALYAGREPRWITSTTEVYMCEVWCLGARLLPSPICLTYPSTFGKSLGEDAASVLLSFIDRAGSLAPLRTLEQKSRLTDEILEKILGATL